MNLLLKSAGLLEGEQGDYSVTEAGRRHATETLQSASQKTTCVGITWDPAVTAELDLTAEGKQRAREEAQLLRQQAAELRAAQAAAEDATDIAESDGSGINPRVCGRRSRRRCTRDLRVHKGRTAPQEAVGGKVSTAASR